jgi:predicted nucleic acid-binding protein
MVLLDTDVASAFAKVEKFEILTKLFKNKVAISMAVYEELSIPISYGYKFPLEVLNNVLVLSLAGQEIEEYFILKNKYPSLGKGELESIVIAKNRGFLFCSFDKQALKLAQKEKVKSILPLALFQAIKQLVGEEELQKLILDIEEKDRRDLSTIKQNLQRG